MILICSITIACSMRLSRISFHCDKITGSSALLKKLCQVPRMIIVIQLWYYTWKFRANARYVPSDFADFQEVFLYVPQSRPIFNDFNCSFYDIIHYYFLKYFKRLSECSFFILSFYKVECEDGKWDWKQKKLNIKLIRTLRKRNFGFPQTLFFHSVFTRFLRKSSKAAEKVNIK